MVIVYPAAIQQYWLVILLIIHYYSLFANI